MPEALAVIPARYASVRLPGKPLLAETGTPLVVHVARRAAAARSVGAVVVATDDPRIADAVEAAGFKAAMTRADHQSGTERVAEAARAAIEAGFAADVVLNVQGDEPEIDPDHLDLLVRTQRATGAFASTLACPFAEDAREGPGSPLDPNCVKAVLAAPDAAGARRALYFTRSPAPYPRDAAGRAVPGAHFRLHLGVYAFAPESLQRFAAAPPSPLETIERLEQLRILEMGETVMVAEVAAGAPGVDTPQDYAAFVERERARAGLRA